MPCTKLSYFASSGTIAQSPVDQVTSADFSAEYQAALEMQQK